MAKVYASLCEKGVRNFYSVPKNLQPQVKILIMADGYVINDDGTVTKPFGEVQEEGEA